MPEQLDSSARIAKLRALGLADKYADLVTQHALETAADAEIASIETKLEAEREAKRARETPIIVPWSATPADSSDLVLFCPERRPHRFTPIEVNGQRYTVALPTRTIGFVEDTLRPVLPQHTEFGWSYGTVRQAVFLLELGLAYATTCINRLNGDALPLLLCIYRAYVHSTAPAARSLATVAYSQLVQFGHAPGGYVHSGDRNERARDEAEAARIWEMAGADAFTASEEPVDAQIRMANEQSNRLAALQSERADRAAAIAERDAKVADAIALRELGAEEFAKYQRTGES